MMASGAQDEEDHNETFGSMFDAEVELKEVAYCFGGVDFRIKASHLYYGKTSKFMPLTVWPACDSFLEFFLAELARGEQGGPARLLPEAPERCGPVLELGAGTGMLSVVLGRLCGHLFPEVVSTDARSSSLGLMEFNRQANLGGGGQVLVAPLVWAEEEEKLEPTHRGKYGLVLGTDVVFCKDAIAPLVSTVKFALRPGGTCLLANHTIRVDNLEDRLFEVCKQKQVSIEMLGFCDAEQSIKLHRIRRD